MNRVITIALTLVASANLPGDTQPFGKIVFTQFIKGQREIMIMDADGSNKNRLTDNAVPGHAPSDMSGSMSKHGKILFISDPENHGWMSLFQMNADGSDLERLTPKPTSRKYGSWDANISPNGQVALYTSEAKGRAEVYSMNIQSREHQRLTTSGGATTPSWSSDGRKIAYVLKDKGVTSLWTMLADGTDPRRITNGVQLDTRPAWSPTGKQLAYVAGNNGKWLVQLIDLESNAERTLTDRAGKYTSLSYSPDGRYIVFDGKPERGRGSVIYTIATNGTGIKQLTNDANNSSQPSWSR